MPPALDQRHRLPWYGWVTKLWPKSLQVSLQNQRTPYHAMHSLYPGQQPYCQSLLEPLGRAADSVKVVIVFNFFEHFALVYVPHGSVWFPMPFI